MNEIIKKYRQYLIFLILTGGGTLLFSLVSLGYYPIIFSEGDFISARSFYKNYYALSSYYENIIKTYGKNFESTRKEPVDLKKIVLEGLIENSLIHRKLEMDVGRDLKSLVRRKIEKFEEDRTLKEASIVLYGLDFDEFKKIVLIPEAERDILIGRLLLRDEKLADWLSQEKQRAKVFIFSPNFKWDGGKVVVGG